MFDSDKPNRAKQWFAFGLMSIGLAIGQQFYPPTLEVVCAVFFFFFTACFEWWTYDIDFLMWRRSGYGDGNLELPKAIAEAVPTPRKVIDLNEKDNIWQNDTVTVKFDMERQFAKGLLIMRDYAIANNQPIKKVVKLTEKKWVKPNKFKSRDELIAVIDKWGDGVVARESAAKNATYIIRDWLYVERVADGLTLPPLPR